MHGSLCWWESNPAAGPLSHVSVSNRTSSMWVIPCYYPWLIIPHFYEDSCFAIGFCCFKSKASEKTQWAVSLPDTLMPFQHWNLHGCDYIRLHYWSQCCVVKVKALQWGRVSLSQHTLCWKTVGFDDLFSYYYVLQCCNCHNNTLYG